MYPFKSQEIGLFVNILQEKCFYYKPCGFFEKFALSGISARRYSFFWRQHGIRLILRCPLQISSSWTARSHDKKMISILLYIYILYGIKMHMLKHTCYGQKSFNFWEKKSPARENKKLAVMERERESKQISVIDPAINTWPEAGNVSGTITQFRHKTYVLVTWVDYCMIYFVPSPTQ